MTIKPEVLAAVNALDCIWRVDPSPWLVVRAELLAMDARLAEAVKDAERWRALHLAEAPMVTITGSQLARGIRPGDYAVPWDWPITSRTRIRMVVMHNSAREVAKSAPVDQIRYDNLHISALILSTSTVNKLISGGVVYVSDLCGKSAIDLLKMDRFGKKSLDQIERALAINGMRLRNWDEPEYKVTP